jgi:hypothetical protein
MGKRVDQRCELSADALPGTRAERVGQRPFELPRPCARLEQRVSGRLLQPVQQKHLLLPRVSREPTGVLEQLLEELRDAGALTGVREVHVDFT